MNQVSVGYRRVQRTHLRLSRKRISFTFKRRPLQRAARQKRDSHIIVEVILSFNFNDLMYVDDGKDSQEFVRLVNCTKGHSLALLLIRVTPYSSAFVFSLP